MRFQFKLGDVAVKNGPRIRLYTKVFSEHFGHQILSFVESDGDLLIQRQFDEKQEANRVTRAEIPGRVECGGGGGGVEIWRRQVPMMESDDSLHRSELRRDLVGAEEEEEGEEEDEEWR